MHSHCLPSFFLTKRTGAPQGEALGQINPLLSNSWICFFSSASPIEAMRYGTLKIGAVPGKTLILNSISRIGGSPGRSSGKKSRNSHITSGILTCFLESKDSSTPFNYLFLNWGCSRVTSPTWNSNSRWLGTRKVTFFFLQLMTLLPWSFYALIDYRKCPSSPCLWQRQTQSPLWLSGRLETSNRRSL